MLEDKLKRIFKGDVDSTEKTRQTYSVDASIFELTPELVMYPKDTADITNLALLCNKMPGLSITPRSAGTDMSGGAISDSLLVDMTRYFNRIGQVSDKAAQVQPGVYYRDLEPELIKHDAQLPAVPASRELCTVGGMVANNSGGERSLQFGNTENFVSALKAVFADGNEYDIRPLNKEQLNTKMAQEDFEGHVYKEVFKLIESDYEHIKNARPKTNKNSMGYNLWSVWDRETGIFDLTHLMCGSQGTLGVVTDITFQLTPLLKHSGLVVAQLHDIKDLGEVINKVLQRKPTLFEGYDDITYDLAIKNPGVFKKSTEDEAEFNAIKTSLQADRTKHKQGLPKITLLIQFEAATEEEVTRHVQETTKELGAFDVTVTAPEDELERKKYWCIRRAHFALLRQMAGGSGNELASPFIDDAAVRPEFLPEFLPKLYKIIERYQLPATVAGHFGDGNFHVIPVMQIADQKVQNKVEPALDEVAELVLQYEGTLAGEHNDGMVRGPWLGDIFGARMLRHFNHVKAIFDPNGIFNPHKKTDATWEFSYKHIRK